MIKKQYVSATGIHYTFPVTVKNKTVWISFKGNENDFITSDKDIQKAIEAHERFENGEIILAGKVPEESNEMIAGSGFEVREFPEVTNINGVVEVLRDEPYHIPFNKLKKPENILTEARAVNAVFPNLK